MEGRTKSSASEAENTVVGSANPETFLEVPSEEHNPPERKLKQFNIFSSEKDEIVNSTEQIEVEEAIDVLQNLDNWDD